MRHRRSLERSVKKLARHRLAPTTLAISRDEDKPVIVSSSRESGKRS